VESETALAVLTSAPGEGERNILTNAEIAATRELLDRLAGAGRLLHHAIVHPNLVGPAAAAFPDLDLLVYHSGYEAPRGEADEEGPFQPGATPRGTDRLVASLAAAGVPPCANVWAELGSTWQCLVRRPREAAHVLGKLLLAVGEDRVLWGTDSIWYGSPQPLIDAFRAFRIPDELRERHGYPELTPAIKRKILGENAARVYGLDLARLRERVRSDDLAWVRAALADQLERGVPRV
jgi:uncharacterized protein